VCFAVLPLFAQEPQLEEIPPPAPQSERNLPAALSANKRTISSEADVVGTNGTLFLESGSDVILRANNALRFQTGGATDRFWFFSDGHASFGTGSNEARLSVFESTGAPAIPAMQVYKNSTTSTSSQADAFSLLARNYMNIPAGVTNSGSMYGTHVDARNLGPGTMTNINGVSIYAGNYSSGGGSATNVRGLFTQVQSSSGTIANGYGVVIADTTATNDWGLFQAGADDSNYFAGSVGIGTTAPQGKVHIMGGTVPLRVDAANAGGFGAAFLDLTTAGYAQGVALDMRGPSHISVGGLQLANLGVPVVRSETSTSPLYLNRWSSTDVVIGGPEAISANIGLRVEGQGTSAFRGAVGIGTTTPNPLYKLHVVGHANFEGTVTGTNIKAHYQDVAEWVPSVTSLPPATVVVLDGARANHVSPSSRPYDTSVAGVVSAEPGIILGEEGPSKALIATTGRVLVRVDASRQPIAIGDLLVTSDKPGLAMKSIPIDLQGIALHRPGTVVGKALESLASGEGEILVLLSLQ
jgi:hypothetical protein